MQARPSRRHCCVEEHAGGLLPAMPSCSIIGAVCSVLTRRRCWGGQPRIVSNPIDRGDPVQCLTRERGFCRLVHIKEFAPRVRHTGRFDDPVAIEPSVASIAIGLQDVAEVTQVGAWMLALAVGK